MNTMINKETMCSNFLTKNELTVYDEGLSYKIFDQRHIYDVRRYADDVCFFIKKEVGLMFPVLEIDPNNSNIIEYMLLQLKLKILYLALMGMCNSM